MFRWQTWVGMAVGFVAGLFILSMASTVPRKQPPTGPILSECDGALRELVIHYEPGAREMVTPVYREFLRALEPAITVHIVCPGRSAFDELVGGLGSVPCQLLPLVVDHQMTTWSRDRWVALSPALPGSPTTLWSPRGETGDEIWPARAGDERLGLDIAAALGPSVTARRSELYFDGGDFLADSENVFVIPRVLQRNLQHTVVSRHELLGILETTFRKRVVLLNESPDHHAGMFMASIGRRTMLVGDPSLSKKFQPFDLPPDGCMASTGSSPPDFEPDFTDETQRLFDAVAAQCSSQGYSVVRIPTVPGRDGRSYLTYVNVVMDQRAERRIVYLPVYRGAEALNAAAQAVWERLGYEVHPVDCTRVFRHFGCLHCLVNVLSR